ncbi:MAG: undecaprenyldiphospho-muramoylpentapeptide beta-N-acetylglucosaminyltransferase, partial [Armatimonadetes bacterium]|nr:undecaprenyldiphospho-muramoylpentapeptide beta-N-acetylglucosaminyltransferase [Armatimonadota bacterium]
DFKTLFIGNPIRGKIIKVSKEEGYKILDLNKENPIILISGASQGSKSINQAVLKALPFWREQNWQIIHLTGEKHFNEVKENSKNLLNGSKLKYYCFPYLEDIQYAYVVCSLIISRGGATTLSEITALGIPAVLIPYPYSLDFHQYYNIDFLVRNKAAIMLKEEELNKLPELILELFSNPLRLEELSVNSKLLGKPRAALEISEIIFNFLLKKGEVNEKI